MNSTGLEKQENLKALQNSASKLARLVWETRYKMNQDPLLGSVKLVSQRKPLLSMRNIQS